MKTTTFRHYRNALRAYVLPKFADRMISNINREDIQALLAEKATKYSCSALRSMRVVIGLTLGWASDCCWLERNPCTRIKLPQQTGRQNGYPHRSYHQTTPSDRSRARRTLCDPGAVPSYIGTSHWGSDCDQVVGFRWKRDPHLSPDLRRGRGLRQNRKVRLEAAG